jgi:general secretion pathway protein D
MRKPVCLVLLVFAAAALGAWAAEAKAETKAEAKEEAAKRYVRFESGHELLISDVREEGEWMIFELADGGEVGVQKSRVQKVGKADGVVFVIGPMDMLERTGAAAARGAGHGGQVSPPGDSQRDPQTTATARGSLGTLGGVGGAVQQEPGEAGPSSSESKLPSSEKEKEEQTPEALKKGFILSMGAPEFASTGQSFTAEVVALGAQDLGYVGFYVSYPADLLEGVSVQDGGFLTSDGEQASFQVRIRQDKGLVIVGIARFSKTVGVSGSGTVLHITFRALAPGSAILSLTNVSAKTAARANLPVSVLSASVSID